MRCLGKIPGSCTSPNQRFQPRSATPRRAGREVRTEARGRKAHNHCTHLFQRLRSLYTHNPIRVEHRYPYPNGRGTGLKRVSKYMKTNKQTNKTESVSQSKFRLGRAQEPCTCLRVFFRLGLGPRVLALARVRVQIPRGRLGLYT